MTVISPSEELGAAIGRVEHELADYFTKKIRISAPGPCTRASECGHQCPRYLYYCLHDWQNRKAPDLPLVMVYEVGGIWHDIAEHWLRQAGISLQRQNEPFQIKGRSGKPIIQGHIDGMVSFGDGPPESRTLVPVEIKSLHPNLYDGINTVTDFYKKPWMAKYPGQLLMYCYAHSAETGFWMLVNKSTGEYKFLPLVLVEHLPEAEAVLSRAEIVEAAVKANEPPERHVDWDTCEHCDFYGICLPPMKLDPKIIFADDAAVVTALTRRAELEPQRGEYDGLDDQIKTWAKAKADGAIERMISVGDWLVTVTTNAKGSKRVTAKKLAS